MSLRAFCGLAALAACAVLCVRSSAQAKPAIEPTASARLPNTEATYSALRTAGLGAESYHVAGLTLKREGAQFLFDDGQIAFYGPVNGRITGAVFTGKGRFQLTPSDPSEQHSLALLTKTTAMDQEFATLVLRFTDATAAEIQKAAQGASTPTSSAQTQAATDFRKNFREKIHANIDLRLLEDVLGSKPGETGGFFLASFRAGGFFAGKNLLFIVDPDGTMNASPDQVELSTWDEFLGPQVWAAYPLASASSARISPVHVLDEDLNIALERSGKMTNTAIATMAINSPTARLVRMDLYPTLRVSGVFAEDGSPLDFIQENKDADPDFAFELPTTTNATPLRVLIKYGGPDAVVRQGPDIYDLVGAARTSWYPAAQEVSGGFASYHMTFHVPKGLQVVATGNQISSNPEPGGQKIVWATSAPIPVAGFNVGNFKKEEAKTPQGFTVDAFADLTLPDFVADHVEELNLGTMTTTEGLKDQVSQGNAAIQIYSDYFGKLPYDHVSLTQQNSCLDGQGWPTMVYLPICAFWDSTIRQRLGLMGFGMDSFWREVTPHEVAHQWWGDLVGWSSYRDQWMSEGFATFSAGLFLLHTSNSPKDFHAYWAEQHTALLRKSAEGIRPIDAGPLTMGYRVNNSKNGGVYQALIYSKGAYVLHMLEMMYFTQAQQEQTFKLAMQQFVKDFSGKAATTEDFKASLEKNLPTWVDIDNNGKLDWFFSEYVYGTELPHYDVTSTFTTDADGNTVMHAKVAQSKVSDRFEMLVPIYLELQDGRKLRLGAVVLRGNAAAEKDINLGKLPIAAKRLLVNYNADVLSD